MPGSPRCEGEAGAEPPCSQSGGWEPLGHGHITSRALEDLSLGDVVWAWRWGWGWGQAGLAFGHLYPPPALLVDEPTSPSIDLQAKHVPASAVVSSAMNSAPVLGTSPSSPTFTFALGRHYSQDCSECSLNPSPVLSLAAWSSGVFAGPAA